MRILVVEDSLVAAMALEEELEERLHQVRIAGSLRGAREWMAEERYDAALLDMHLPDGPSDALAAELERAGCIVALVSGIDAGDVPSTLEHLPLFQKPIQPAILASWIDSLLQPD